MKLSVFCFLLLACCLRNAFGGQEANLGERIRKLVKTTNGIPEVKIDEKLAKKAIVTKIQVWEGWMHWTARITTEYVNSQGTKETLKLVAELATGFWDGDHEQYKALTKKRADEYPEQHAEIDAPVDGGTGKPLTLARLMQCVTGDDIETESGMCFIYTFRVMLFASGQCACNECIPGMQRATAKYLGNGKEGPHLLELKNIMKNTQMLTSMIDKVKEKPIKQGIRTPDELTEKIMGW